MIDRTVKAAIVTAVLVWVAAGVAACEPRSTDQEVMERKERNAYHYAPGTVSDFTLEDGTRCIFVKDGYGAGLSCNFKEKQ